MDSKITYCKYTERNIAQIDKPYFYGMSNYVKFKRKDHHTSDRQNIWKINVKSGPSNYLI